MTSGASARRPCWHAHGRGDPVTLVVPGLGSTEGEARIPASGLRGTRVIVSLPGHGSAPDAPPGYWDYGRVARDVHLIADEVGATRAVGVSLGAGALTRLAADHPDRFERLALLLPAALARPREVPARWAFERLVEAVDVAAVDGGARLREVVAADLPANADVGDHVERRAAALLRLREALNVLPEQTPLADSAPLAAVTAAVLVIGAVDDPLHPSEVAKATAAAFGHADLELLPSAAPMLTHRRELRELMTGFLN